jgi:hypothetical protein
LQIDQISEFLEGGSAEPGAWENEYPHFARLFSSHLARNTLADLLEASQASALYQLTDFHWYLVYYVLQPFVEIHNDSAREDPSGRMAVGAYLIGQIDFTFVLDHFFWDLDFLHNENLLNLSPAQRHAHALSGEAWSIAAGLSPHHDELALHVWTGPPHWEPDTGMYPVEGIIAAYPRKSEEEATSPRGEE